LRVIFSERAYLAVLAETSEKIATETGGIFLGCFENGTFYVVEAIDPGPKSTFQVAYFEYDQKYTQHLINKIARLYSHKLTLVGLWHRHPGSFDQFSSTDDGTNRKYAQMSDNGAVSVLVNIDPKFRITAYHVANPLKYSRISYEIGDSLIPEHIKRQKTSTELQTYINGYEKRKSSAGKSLVSRTNLKSLMDTIKANFDEFSMDEADAETTHVDSENPDFRDYLTDSILDDISYFSEEKGIVLTVQQEKDKNKIILSQKDGTAKISFAYFPSLRKILFSYENRLYLYSQGLFSRLLKDSPSEDNSESKNNSFKSELFKAIGIIK